MGYFELLPTPEDVSDQLSQAGLTATHRREALSAVAYFLGEHSDYYENQWQRDGEKEDRGSHDTLKQLSQEFYEAARAVTDSEPSAS